jgi:hemerythrin superfamily protein
MKSAVTLLKQDHAKVKKLLSELQKATAPSKQEALLEQIEEEVTLHATVEEEIFYPAFRDAAKRKKDGEMFHEALAEHNVVKIVIPDLQQTPYGSEEFAGKAKVLKELIEHHAKEEEDEMFPRAQVLLDARTLQELGARIEERKSSLKGATAVR